MGIEHACTAEKGRDSDKERDQGQPEAKALLEKVEKEVKKTRGASHPKKLDGHYRDYILLLFFRLARRAPLFVFFFFLCVSKIVSHLPFAYKWQNRVWDSEPIVTSFPSNKDGTLHTNPT